LTAGLCQDLLEEVTAPPNPLTGFSRVPGNEGIKRGGGEETGYDNLH